MPYTDIRAIDMCRAPRMPGLQPLSTDGAFLTIGHFDHFRVKRLSPNRANDTRVDLSLIQKHNQALSHDHADTYFQPVYILREFKEDERTRVEEFWGLPSAFLLVTRVHANTRDQEEFEVNLADCLQNVAAGNGRPVKIEPYCAKERNSEEDEEVVRYILYRTLEFSDNILVAKSDSIEALFKTVGNLYYLPCVGDVYSYFGIAPSELTEDPGLASEKDKISRALMRFAVKAAGKSRDYLNGFIDTVAGNLGDRVGKPLFVNGTEDLMLIAHDLNSREFCSMLRLLLQSGGLRDEKLFWNAFDDMTTRLSIEEKNLGPHEDESPNVEPTLYGKYCSLYDKFHEIYALYDDKKQPYPDWIRPAAELIKSMRTISRDCILYQLCFIVLDGVNAIVRLANEIANDSLNAAKMNKSYEKELVKVKEEMLRDALTGISNLMENMIRMEGELVHHPETRPLLYDIPANLLELYLHFSDMCLTYYQRREGRGADDRFQLLLLPCLCETITVSAVDGRNSEDADFLYVKIPLHMLYDSRYVICSLVHEVAHYGGEETRQRDARFYGAAYSALTQALSTFEVELPEGDRPQQIEALHRELVGDIPEDCRKYMRELRPALGDAIKNRLLHDPFKGKFTTDEQTEETVEHTREIVEQTEETVKLFLDELVELYREAYADLAMVSLLDLKPQDYIDVLKRNYESLSDVAQAYTVERGALVIITIWPKPWQREISRIEGLPNNIAAYLRKYNDNSEMGGKYHSREAVRAICSYLKTCYEKMTDFDAMGVNAGEADNIRKCFRNYAEDQKFASSEFYKELEAHREKLMELKLG